VDTLLRTVHPHTWMADTNIGEMFLNFVLHGTLRELAGVDVTHYREASENPTGVCWGQWTRCAMGLKPSPYKKTQVMMVAEDVIRGNPSSGKNVFKWDDACLNLPGSETYDPRLPRVYKVQKDGKPAAEFSLYVDDNWTTGNLEGDAWLAAQLVARMCTYLDIQNAARKRRKASQTPGAWAGAVVATGEDGLSVRMCSYLDIQNAARKRRKASQTPGAWAGAVVATGEDGLSVSVSKEKRVKAKGFPSQHRRVAKGKGLRRLEVSEPGNEGGDGGGDV
jgi:hypothetical protein